jgi:hypothetical protein
MYLSGRIAIWHNSPSIPVLGPLTVGDLLACAHVTACKGGVYLEQQYGHGSGNRDASRGRRFASGFRIWVRSTTDDFSAVELDDLAGHGVFKIWADWHASQSARITDAGAVEWLGDVAVCVDALYLGPANNPRICFPSCTPCGW